MKIFFGLIAIELLERAYSVIHEGPEADDHAHLVQELSAFIQDHRARDGRVRTFDLAGWKDWRL